MKQNKEVTPKSPPSHMMYSHEISNEFLRNLNDNK